MDLGLAGKGGPDEGPQWEGHSRGRERLVRAGNGGQNLRDQGADWIRGLSSRGRPVWHSGSWLEAFVCTETLPQNGRHWVGVPQPCR